MPTIAPFYDLRNYETVLEKVSTIPLRYRGMFTGFYSVNFKAYKAFYRVIEDYIEVLRIIPAKCNYMRILFGESEQD